MDHSHCFSASCSFETLEFYEWAMHEVRKFLVGQNVELNGAIFVTDRELALMSAISTVMPETNQILCQWHINKNLLAKHRASFNSEDAWKEFMMLWQSLVNSPTTTEYNFRLNLLREQVPETVATYLLTTWLPHKERIVLAWTLNFKHFGNLTTSRVEGSYATIKKWLQVSTGDMLRVCSLLEKACDDQERRLSQSNNFQKTHNLVGLNQSLWGDVTKKISRYALTLARAEYQKSLNSEYQPCTKIFTATMGIPCSHTIIIMLENRTNFTVIDFDKYWWLTQPEQVPPVLHGDAPVLGNLIDPIEERYD